MYPEELYYEKLYKEARERAKKLNCDGAYANQSTIVKIIFPELANDDEDIRKEIIDYLRIVGKGKDDYAQFMIDRWIAWLEKFDDFQFNYPGDKSFIINAK